MRRSNLFPLLLILLVIATLTLGGCRNGGAAAPGEQPNPAHPSVFMTREELYRYLGEAEKEGNPPAAVQNGTAGRFVSGVLPHHLVASRLIVPFMSALAAHQPAVIILVGPNHENRGGRVITGLYDWQTPEGKVKTDQEITRLLLEKGLAVRDEEVLSREHSVGALIPFIGRFMPQARVVPLVFHHDVSLREIDALLAALGPCLESGAVVMASVDFSHYLTRQEAEAKDEITLRAMRGFDYTALYKMDNDHLDSPASLTMAFRAAEKLDIKDFEVLGHTNSGIIFKNDIIETTSYFTLVFKEN